jgi:hypothetical protein
MKPSGAVVVPWLGWLPVDGLGDRTKSKLNSHPIKLGCH